MNLEKDYYQILGVSPKATSTQIRQAYRRLAIRYHPDRNPSPEATLRMQEINEAYSTLGDKRKRIEYDSERSTFTPGSPATPPPQRTSAPPRPAPPKNLQQVFAENIARGIRFFSQIITLVLILGAIFMVCNLATFEFRFVMFAVYFLIFGGGLLFVLELLKTTEIYTRCPKCHELGAAEKLNEELIGVSQRKGAWLELLGIHSAFIMHERYKIHYRCKYCSYEWLFIYTKKQSIL